MAYREFDKTDEVARFLADLRLTVSDDGYAADDR